MTIYDIGDRRRLVVTFRDEDGSLADPTAVTFAIREPDDLVTTYVYGTDVELVRDSVGVYHVHWDIAQAGWHHWRFEGAGSVGVAEESRFQVRESLVNEELS